MPSVNKERRQRIRELAETEPSMAAIARKEGVSEADINYFLRTSGSKRFSRNGSTSAFVGRLRKKSAYCAKRLIKIDKQIEELQAKYKEIAGVRAETNQVINILEGIYDSN